ncbi:carbonic anhydrase 1-like [Littorina saxatilis]|uniref:Carbonic anhydrase n=1 Tax=Littorina saxatilis TaxID=31220 RepID=A0AAN9AUF4_9CAEN
MAQTGRQLVVLSVLVSAISGAYITSVEHNGQGEIDVTYNVALGQGEPYKEQMCSPSDRHFSYNPSSSAGPSQWWRISQCCGGHLQSPIALDRHRARCASMPTPQYSMGNVSMKGKLHDSGHHVMLTFASDVTRPRLCNVGKKSDVMQYVLDHVHMHFGSPYSRGSEHVIDDEQFQGEIHMVHYKAEHGSVSEAMLHRDGLTVVAIPISSQRGDQNDQLYHLLQAVQGLDDVEHSVPFTLTPDALLPGRRDMFYYRGSLTTPPCSETVQFLVVDQPLHVSPDQLQVLWRLPSSEKSVPISRYGNVRPLVPANNRPVLTNFVCWCCIFQ